MNEPQDPDPNDLYAAMVEYREILSNARRAGFSRKEASKMALAMVLVHTEGGSRDGHQSDPGAGV